MTSHFADIRAAASHRSGCAIALRRTMGRPLRVALVVSGLMLVAPGGGIMPLSSVQMTLAALSIAVSLAALLFAFALLLGLSMVAGRRRAVREVAPLPVNTPVGG